MKHESGGEKSVAVQLVHECGQRRKKDIETLKVWEYECRSASLGVML
jgi:hypothetical protein